MEEKVKDKLIKFKDKLRDSESAYTNILEEIKDNNKSYLGTREITKPGNNNMINKVKSATNVRRVTYELIESQIDGNIPQPKVVPREQQNEANAQAIEYMLKNEIDRLPFETMNDEQERVCPIAGGSLFLVEWDNSQKSHNTLGELNVKVLDIKAFIPQRRCI